MVKCFKYMIEESMKKNLYDFPVVKNICLCISEEPPQCWQNKQPLGVFKTGFALHEFKVEILRAFLQRHIRPDLKGKSLQSF